MREEGNISTRSSLSLYGQRQLDLLKKQLTDATKGNDARQLRGTWQRLDAKLPKDGQCICGSLVVWTFWSSSVELWRLNSHTCCLIAPFHVAKSPKILCWIIQPAVSLGSVAFFLCACTHLPAVTTYYIYVYIYTYCWVTSNIPLYPIIII